MKLKELLAEYNTLARGAFVIDNKGYIHELEYHGDIFNLPQFKSLKDEVMTKLNMNQKTLNYKIKSGTEDILKFLDEKGFVRGGIWSKDKKQLYFTIKPSKISSAAKIGMIKKISKFKPAAIFLEDLEKNKYGLIDVEEFIDNYL